MKNHGLFQKTKVVLCALAAAFLVTALVSCNGLWQDCSLTVSLPASASRSIDSVEVAEIRKETGSWSVSVAVENGPTYERSGEGGQFIFGGLSAGSNVTVRVECLAAADGRLLAFAEKTIVITGGTNAVSINMARDGISIAALEREKSNQSVKVP